MTSANQADKPVYPTYSRGMTLQHRLYLEAVTGEVFR